MEYLDGRVFVDQTLPELPASERHVIYEQMNNTIAAIHRLDYTSLGLESFGKPGNYFLGKSHAGLVKFARQTFPFPIRSTS